MFNSEEIVGRFDINPNVTINENIYFDFLRITKRKNQEIDLDVFLETKGFKLQRDLVWSLSQRRELIYSMLKGIKIPPITVINEQYEGKVIYKVIDGKQRISTILSFVNNEFSILTTKNKEIFFSDFDSITKSRLHKGFPNANEYYSYPEDEDKKYFISDQDMINIFLRVNFSGTDQDFSHINKLKNK